MEFQKILLQKKSRLEFDFYCSASEKRNYTSLVNISPTVVIDTSMERSLKVLAITWKAKNYLSIKWSKLDIELF